MYGAFYPVGGAPAIAKCLLNTVANAGGWTRVRALVDEILIERGRAVGVRMAGGEEIRAKRGLSCRNHEHCESLVAASARGDWCDEDAQLNPAPAHLCLYLGFKGDIQAAGAGAANKWFYNTWDMEFDEWEVQPNQPLTECPVLYCSFPSLKDLKS